MGGFINGSSQQTPAARALLEAPRSARRTGVTRKKKKRVAKKATRRTATKRAAPKKRARLKKGSPAAKAFMAKLRKMQKKKKR